MRTAVPHNTHTKTPRIKHSKKAINTRNHPTQHTKNTTKNNLRNIDTHNIQHSHTRAVADKTQTKNTDHMRSVSVLSCVCVSYVLLCLQANAIVRATLSCFVLGWCIASMLDAFYVFVVCTCWACFLSVPICRVRCIERVNKVYVARVFLMFVFYAFRLWSAKFARVWGMFWKFRPPAIYT